MLGSVRIGGSEEKVGHHSDSRMGGGQKFLLLLFYII
jgi:hypothetical protein